eukprot:CCRYP_013821-RA/>CCRYP_013821-RA protein AED:0.40 eAED:0.18 QI:0/-1/0/1/-1/1/1/0/357
MLNAFNKESSRSNPDLEIDCVQTYHELEIFGIDPMYASVFDGPLNVEQFMQVVGYMEGQYADCCKRCKRSGEMENFIEYINGLLWLGYMRCTFMAVGDSSLHNTVFSALPASVLNESTGGAPGARQKGWSGSSRSTSPVPPGGSGKKYKASSAIQYAAESLDTRMSDLNRTENFNACMALTDKRDEAEEEMIELDDRLGAMKSMRKVTKRRGEPFADEAEYQRLKKKTKTTHAKYNRLAKKVNRLEKLLGYDDKSTGDKSSSFLTMRKLVLRVNNFLKYLIIVELINMNNFLKYLIIVELINTYSVWTNILLSHSINLPFSILRKHPACIHFSLMLLCCQFSPPSQEIVDWPLQRVS